MDLALETEIRKLKSGDSSAFDKVYEMTYRKIFFLVLPILKDRALAEDIVQDTYLKFLEKLYDYQNRNSLAYILTIAKNLAINEYNKRKREVRDVDMNTKAFALDEYLEIDAVNEETIKSALGVLDQDERNVFLLHNLENLTHREIALIIDKPLGTVTWIHQQAIKKMRKHLKG